MAKPNYQFEKRKRDIAKKTKKEEKKLRKAPALQSISAYGGDEVSLETTKLVAGHVKIGAVRSGDCRAGQELTIQLARSRTSI